MHLSKPIIAVLIAGIAAAGLVTTTFALMPQSFSFLGFRNTANGGFTISSIPSSLSLQARSSSMVTLTIVSTDGLTAVVSMSASTSSGSQSSLTAALNQTTVSIKPGASGKIYLEITANAGASSGNYSATVLATSGSISRSLSIPITVTPPVFESLSFNGYSFPTNTSVTLDIGNMGTTSVNFVSYNITDSKGDMYSLTSWAGPTINPNQAAAVTFYIGPSCSGCTLTGSPFNFTINYPYTISVITGRNNHFGFQA